MVVECYFVGMFSNCGWDVVQLMRRGGIGRVMSRFSKEPAIGTEKNLARPNHCLFRVCLMFSDGRYNICIQNCNDSVLRSLWKWPGISTMFEVPENVNLKSCKARPSLNIGLNCLWLASFMEKSMSCHWQMDEGKRKELSIVNGSTNSWITQVIHQPIQKNIDPYTPINDPKFQDVPGIL